MPTFTHGKDVDLYWAGYDVANAFRKVDTERNQQATDVTCFGDSNRRFKVGLADGKLSAEGIYDNDADGAVMDTDTKLLAAFETPYPSICVALEGDAIGNPVELLGAGVQSLYSIESPVEDITAVKCEAMAAHGLERCVSLHAMGAESAGTILSTSVDNAASSASGAVGVLQVSAATAGTVVVKIQHSTNNSTWVDLITFTSVAAAGAPVAERIVVTGTVNRYLRAQAVVTTGPATYHVAAGRTPRNG